MQKGRGFTQESLEKAQKTKLQNDTKATKSALKRENTLLRTTLNDYQIKYQKIKKELEDFKKANSSLHLLSKCYPYLYKHILSLNLNENSDHPKNGNRFDEQLNPIYILLSMSGKYYTTLLHTLFGFPCTRTCTNIKNRYKEMHGIDETIFDGSCESIIKLLNMFWDSEDRKCVISVDAAAVNAKLTVHKDGRIEGLLDELTIEKELVESITKDPDEFHKFYDKHRDEIIKYYFVFYACSLDENAKSFPIALKKKTNGSADINITADLEELVFRCQDLGLEVMGISFDGDKSYLKYVIEMCQEIDKLGTLNLKEPLSSLFKKYSGILAYEDMMHLVKCCRYRFV